MDYVKQARTHHKDLDAPSFLLEQRITHKMNIANVHKRSETIDIHELKKVKKDRAVYQKTEPLEFIHEKNENGSLAFLEEGERIQNLK